MGRPFVRVGVWEIGCYIYDNFFEIQVRMAMEVTEIEVIPLRVPYEARILKAYYLQAQDTSVWDG